MDKQTAYRVLGLVENASEEEIKAAYKTLAQKYNVENYEAGPLKDEANAKMDEINEAFDTLMSYIRTGQDQIQAGGSGPSAGGRYGEIRKLIHAGQVDQAISELSAIQGGSADAEWNFLMGSAYYYKGWLEQALQYFQIAVRMDPANREYEAALRNLQGSADGNMQGNPFMNQDPNAAAVNCACNTCTLMCCMDACCSMGRGC